jgi:hypothetical protein
MRRECGDCRESTRPQGGVISLQKLSKRILVEGGTKRNTRKDHWGRKKACHTNLQIFFWRMFDRGLSPRYETWPSTISRLDSIYKLAMQVLELVSVRTVLMLGNEVATKVPSRHIIGCYSSAWVTQFFNSSAWRCDFSRGGADGRTSQTDDSGNKIDHVQKLPRRGPKTRNAVHSGQAAAKDKYWVRGKLETDPMGSGERGRNEGEDWMAWARECRASGPANVALAGAKNWIPAGNRIL